MTAGVNPGSLVRASRDFFVAGTHLLNHPSTSPLPAVFLLARSIELSLKSVLLNHGLSGQQLARKPFGHDLGKLWTEAASRSSVCGALSLDHAAAIDILTADYASASLSYIDSGRRYLIPRLDLLEEAASNLLRFALSNIRSET